MRISISPNLQSLAGPAAGPGGGQVFIDGFTGGRLPPKQSIREVRINQDPFAAQFDRPGHGRIEIFTKPGTDNFHGDILYQFSDAAFNSRNPFVTSKPPYRRKQWEGEVSGPLNKKTSFSLDFERRDINENAVVNAQILDSALNVVPFTQAVVTPLAGLESNLKIDRQLTTNHTLTVRLGYARDTNDNSGVAGFSLPGRAYHQVGDEDTFQVIETGVLNPHTVMETRFRYRTQNSDQNGGTSAPVISVLDAFTSGGSSVGNSFDHQKRYELQNSTSYVHGVHTLRWGGILRAVNLNNQAMQNYTGTFTSRRWQAIALPLLESRTGSPLPKFAPPEAAPASSPWQPEIRWHPSTRRIMGSSCRMTGVSPAISCSAEAFVTKARITFTTGRISALASASPGLPAHAKALRRKTSSAWASACSTTV